MRKILVIGAASAIAQETIKLFAKDGDSMYLTDLKYSRLVAISEDFQTRYNVNVFIKEFDVLDFDEHSNLIADAADKLGQIDIILIAHGTLPDQHKMQDNYLDAITEFNINGLSVISLSTVASQYFESRGKGTLAVISSVAGDRGRQSNYLYGSAKGAVSLFLQGLRNRLSSSEIKVITIKPGMVDTPMTAHLPKGILFAKASAVGKGIYDAILKKKDIAYIPGYWRFVMFIIKHIPESIFKKLKL